MHVSAVLVEEKWY